MSHIIEVRTQIRDPQAISQACLRLKWKPPVHGSTYIFAQKRTGWLVYPPDWRYPIACETDAGTIAYDNYNGHWGDLTRLHEFMQAYAVEKTKIEARKQNHTVFESLQPNGSIKLTVQLGA